MMFGQAIPAAGSVKHAAMASDQAWPTIDFDTLLGFSRFDLEPQKLLGNRVAIVIDGHIAGHVHQALVQPINRWNPDRKSLQVSSFGSKKLTGAGFQFAAILRIDLIAPGPRLSVSMSQS
jgi:hypothetical protein